MEGIDGFTQHGIGLLDKGKVEQHHQQDEDALEVIELLNALFHDRLSADGIGAYLAFLDIGEVLEQILFAVHTTENVVFNLQLVKTHGVGGRLSVVRHELAIATGDGHIIIIEDNTTLV